MQPNIAMRKKKMTIFFVMNIIRNIMMHVVNNDEKTIPRAVSSRLFIILYY